MPKPPLTAPHRPMPANLRLTVPVAHRRRVHRPLRAGVLFNGHMYQEPRSDGVAAVYQSPLVWKQQGSEGFAWFASLVFKAEVRGGHQESKKAPLIQDALPHSEPFYTATFGDDPWMDMFICVGRNPREGDAPTRGPVDLIRGFLPLMKRLSALPTRRSALDMVLTEQRPLRAMSKRGSIKHTRRSGTGSSPL